jgi:hypothetical protein
MRPQPENEALPEPSLTVKEIADGWQISRDSVRRIFSDEPGVLRIGHETRLVGRKYKRRYFTLRIPRSVYLRVLDRMQQR